MKAAFCPEDLGIKNALNHMLNQCTIQRFTRYDNCLSSLVHICRKSSSILIVGVYSIGEENPLCFMNNFLHH